MNVITEMATIALPKAEVFDFLANVENLPLWATAFCESGRWDGDDYKVCTPRGNVVVRLESDSHTGVVDRWTRREGEREWTLLPLRIFDGRVGSSVVCVTCFQSPGRSAGFFSELRGGVQHDLAVLQEVITEQLFVY